MSENGEIYTAGKNFTLPPAVTSWTNSTSGGRYYNYYKNYLRLWLYDSNNYDNYNNAWGRGQANRREEGEIHLEEMMVCRIWKLWKLKMSIPWDLPPPARGEERQCRWERLRCTQDVRGSSQHPPKFARAPLQRQKCCDHRSEKEWDGFSDDFCNNLFDVFWENHRDCKLGDGLAVSAMRSSYDVPAVMIMMVLIKITMCPRWWSWWCWLRSWCACHRESDAH